MLYAKEVKLTEAYNGVAEFVSSIRKIKITVGNEPTVTYRMVFVIDTEDSPLLTRAVFIKSQPNSPIVSQDTPSLRTATNQPLPVKERISLHTRIGNQCV